MTLEFPSPANVISLRAVDGVGQKKLRLSKLVSSFVEMINLTNSHPQRNVQLFSHELAITEMPEAKFNQHHLDYMTLLSLLSVSSGDETFCVLGTQTPPSNSALHQLKYQTIEACAPVVKEFIYSVREAIREKQYSFSSSDIYNDLILQETSGRFSRPNFVFRSLKQSLKDWQKINPEEFARQGVQKRSILEPVVPGWGAQGFLMQKDSRSKSIKAYVHETELSYPYSLASLEQVFSNLREFMYALKIETKEPFELFMSCPYMAIISLANKFLGEVFPKAYLNFDDVIFGWSPVQNLVSTMISEAKASVFLDLNAFPSMRAVIFLKNE